MANKRKASEKLKKKATIRSEFYLHKHGSITGPRIRTHSLHPTNNATLQGEPIFIHDPCLLLLGNDAEGPLDVQMLPVSNKVLKVHNRMCLVDTQKLSRNSNYFRSMFLNFSEKDRKIIELQLDYPKVFVAMLRPLHYDFSFADECFITVSNCAEIVCNAEYLQAESLLENIIEVIARNCEIICQNFPANFGCKSVKKHVMDKIMRKAKFSRDWDKLAFLFLWSKEFSKTDKQECFAFLSEHMPPKDCVSLKLPELLRGREFNPEMFEMYGFDRKNMITRSDEEIIIQCIECDHLFSTPSICSFAGYSSCMWHGTPTEQSYYEFTTKFSAVGCQLSLPIAQDHTDKIKSEESKSEVSDKSSEESEAEESDKSS